MYRPAAFAADDATALAIVDAHPLAHLVLVAEGEIISTPVPLIRRGDALVGHLARPNPVWRHPGPALAIFTGVDAYVSPRWYANKHVDGKVVPTWNYTTVHARGRLVVHDDPAWTLQLVTDLTDRMEGGTVGPWAVADAPADYIGTLVRGIVGIELVGVAYEGKAKLSQNKHAEDVAAVITITRRHDGEAAHGIVADGHRVERIEVGPPGALPWREAWAHRVAVERELTAIGRALSGRRVVWHLRMADVGTLAAAAAARRLGQAVVFTAVPDPHIVIDAMQDSGRIDRSRFAVEDAAEQFWFRARMVERLTAQADRLTLLPRPTIERELVDLLGLDAAGLAARATVVPEGVDVTGIDAARDRTARAAGNGTTTPAVARVLATLPAGRRGLPWVVTVGRLHPAKGPQRIVEAVMSDPTLRDAVNVVVVGGDITSPSPDERSTIERIKLAALGAPDGLVTLTGHLPPQDAGDLVAFASAHGGVYVCASDKEEFGLAVVEALGAGAVVVAPWRGGPRTYVVDGVSGVLCDTLDVDRLHDAIVRARGLVDVPGRAQRTRAMVRAELSVERMAERLGEVYRSLVAARVDA